MKELDKAIGKKDKDSDEKDVVSEALSLDNVEKYTSDGNIVKTIYIPNRLLNFVVK